MAATFGVIGLGTMGSNLALNLAAHGESVAVWNYQPARTARFLGEHPGFHGARTLDELVHALGRPRRILMMITAGRPVDETLEKLTPLLERGDVVVDGGNSWFEDTRRREAALAKVGIHFVGMGVSGGAEGARTGPSLMPGGSAHAWQVLRPVLEAIAAKTEAGPCVTHVGPDGAGHFVKTVHNGIEYGDMQLIAEAYDVLRRGLGWDAARAAAQFQAWNEGRLESFLFELTARILRVREDGAALVDKVRDVAGQKGTGRWTAEVALDLGVPVPTIAAAIDARVLSGDDARREVARALGCGDDGAAFAGDARTLVEALGDALWVAKVATYAQGFELIGAASRAYGWNVDLAEMARIWKGGCIIRARFLDTIRAAYGRAPALSNLLVDDAVAASVRAALPGARRAVATAQLRGLAVPALAASLAYVDALRAARLPQSLTQAQRDAFGAHGYERVDQPGEHHSDWR